MNLRTGHGQMNDMPEDMYGAIIEDVLRKLYDGDDVEDEPVRYEPQPVIPVVAEAGIETGPQDRPAENPGEEWEGAAAEVAQPAHETLGLFMRRQADMMQQALPHTPPHEITQFLVNQYTKGVDAERRYKMNTGLIYVGGMALNAGLPFALIAALKPVLIYAAVPYAFCALAGVFFALSAVRLIDTLDLRREVQGFKILQRSLSADMYKVMDGMVVRPAAAKHLLGVIRHFTERPTGEAADIFRLPRARKVGKLSAYEAAHQELTEKRPPSSLASLVLRGVQQFHHAFRDENMGNGFEIVLGNYIKGLKSLRGRYAAATGVLVGAGTCLAALALPLQKIMAPFLIYGGVSASTVLMAPAALIGAGLLVSVMKYYGVSREAQQLNHIRSLETLSLFPVRAAAARPVQKVMRALDLRAA
jgi:hypothetical protein